MNISLHQKEKTAELIVAGRLDVAAAPQFEEVIRQLDPETRQVSIDAREMNYISSAGLRQLLMLKKRLGAAGTVDLYYPPENVCNLLYTTGFDRFIEIHRAKEESGEEPAEEREYCSLKMMLKRQTNRLGDAPALWEKDRTYSWKDLDRYSQIVASDLQHLGVHKESHVALCGTNSVNWVLTFFAIQKLGAIAVLLNAHLKPAEINRLTQVGDIEFFCYGEVPPMLEDRQYLPKVMGSSIRALYDFGGSPDKYEERMGEYEQLRDQFEEDVEADDPCVLLYTSGTTGEPKGVLHSAYGILHSGYALGDRLHITKEDRACLVLPMDRIFGFGDSFAAVLIHGGMVYLAPNAGTDTMLQMISRYRCTIMNCVPDHFLAMLRNPAFESYDLSGLRIVMLGGALMSPEDMKAAGKKLPGCHLIPAYGLSEMMHVSCVEYEDTEEHLLYTVGHLFPEAEARVVDPATGMPCEPMETGELLVKGANMMLCYYKLDLEKQIMDKDGWLHTGDLVSMDPDGYLSFKGRT